MFLFFLSFFLFPVPDNKYHKGFGLDVLACARVITRIKCSGEVDPKIRLNNNYIFICS